MNQEKSTDTSTYLLGCHLKCVNYLPVYYIKIDDFPLQVIVAAELLKNADELVKCKIHPTSIISGYRLACK